MRFVADMGGTPAIINFKSATHWTAYKFWPERAALDHFIMDAGLLPAG